MLVPRTHTYSTAFQAGVYGISLNIGGEAARSRKRPREAARSREKPQEAARSRYLAASRGVSRLLAAFGGWRLLAASRGFHRCSMKCSLDRCGHD